MVDAKTIMSSPVLPPELSLKDPVTGLYNKKHLIQRLTDCVARADRERQSLVLILWDIDGFIRFNNQHGQKQGDTFLTQVSDIIKKSLRTYDEAFRSGPDEFCAILTPADDVIAREVTERVKGAVAQGLFHDQSEYAQEKFSISAGYVLYPGVDRIPESILHAAQQVLYKNRKK